MLYAVAGSPEMLAILRYGGVLLSELSPSRPAAWPRELRSIGDVRLKHAGTNQRLALAGPSTTLDKPHVRSHTRQPWYPLPRRGSRS